MRFFFFLANLTIRWRQHPGCSPKTPNRKGHESRHSITDHERAPSSVDEEWVDEHCETKLRAGGVRDQG